MNSEDSVIDENNHKRDPPNVSTSSRGGIEKAAHDEDNDGDLPAQKVKKRSAFEMMREAAVQASNKKYKKLGYGVTGSKTLEWKSEEFDNLVRSYIGKDPENNVVLRVHKNGLNVVHFFTTLATLRSSPSKRIRRDFTENLATAYREEPGVYVVQGCPKIVGFILNGLHPLRRAFKSDEFIPGVSQEEWDRACIDYEIDPVRECTYHSSIPFPREINDGDIMSFEQPLSAPVKEVEELEQALVTMWTTLIEKSYALGRAKKKLLPICEILICEGMCLYDAAERKFDTSLTRCLSKDIKYIDPAAWLEEVFNCHHHESAIFDNLETKLKEKTGFKAIVIEGSSEYVPGKNVEDCPLKDCFNKHNAWIPERECSIFSITIRLF